MKFWERIAVHTQQEIFYYDTRRGFDARHLAARLYEMILEELERGKKGVVFLCIGTDRSTGDSLGPLIGYKLKGKEEADIPVFGTLERPVHAMNLDDYGHRRFCGKDRPHWLCDAGKGGAKARIRRQQRAERSGGHFYHRNCWRVRKL